MAELAKESLQETLSAALEEADELLQKAANASEKQAQELQGKATDTIARARKALRDAYDAAGAEGREVACCVDQCVHKNPWQAVGLAAAVGLVAGLLLARK